MCQEMHNIMTALGIYQFIVLVLILFGQKSNQTSTYENRPYLKSSKVGSESGSEYERILLDHFYKPVGKSHDNEPHSVVFVLKRDESIVAALQATLETLSDPNSESYGHWLTEAEIERSLGFASAATALADTLHNQYNIPTADIHELGSSGMVRLSSTISQLNALLEADFTEYSRVKADYSTPGKLSLPNIHRSATINIPAPILALVSDILYTTQFPTPISNTLVSDSRVDSDVLSILPASVDLVKVLYNITNFSVPPSMHERPQVVFESPNQYLSLKDVATFNSLYQRESFKRSHILSMDVNGTIPSVNCVDLQCSQADADLEILTAVTQNVTTYYASVENQEDPFVNLLLKLAELPTNASVVVVAFTTLEVLVHNSILEAFSLEIMKLALKGVTVVTSAGDSGASGPYCWCSSDDFKWRVGLYPMFPASVPFLTTVGGTQVTSASNEKTMREIPCQSNLGSIITTGGGFSNYYSTPSFQAKAVSTYTNTLNSRILNLINSNGRGYPDISLVSSAYTVVVADTVVQFSSTSAAAAVFAGMISLANADRGRKGYPSLGFINPLLYSNGDRGYLSENMPSRIPTTSPSTQTDASIVRYLRRDAPSRSSNVTEVSTQGLFHDITEGNNNCCSAAASIDSLSSSAICCDEGYSATTGWDAVSGWGSIDFQHFLAILPNSSLVKDIDTHYSYRDDDYNDDTFGGFSLAQRLSLILIAVSVASIAFLVLESCFSGSFCICDSCIDQCAESMICCFGEVVIWLDRVIACFTGTDVTQHEGMELLVATDQPRQPPMARPAPTFYGAAGGAIAPNAGVRRARGVQGTTFSQ